MEIVRVPVRFDGHIDIQVPPGLRDDQKKDLAERIALSTILATTNNPDCGEAQQDALDEYAQKFGLDDQLAESDWDRCQVHVGPWGQWTSPDNFPISFELWNEGKLLSRHSVRTEAEVEAVVKAARRIYPTVEILNRMEN